MKLSLFKGTQADKWLRKTQLDAQSGIAIVIHSRSRRKRRFLRFSRFFPYNFHFSSVNGSQSWFPITLLNTFIK